MKTEAPNGEARPGFRNWKRVVAAFLLLLSLGFLLSNLLLTSPWARHWMSGQIEARFGLHTTIGSASWSPWAGVCFNQITLDQPPALRAIIAEPLMKVASVQITPVWRAWLSGNFKIRSISLESPQLAFPLELLTHLVQIPQPTQASPPQMAAVAPPPPALAPAQLGQKRPTAPTPPAKAEIPTSPTGWINVRNASLKLFTATTPQPVFSITTITGSLPIAGKTAKSTFKIGSISCAGRTITPANPANFEWKAPQLSLQPLNLTLDHLKVSLALRLTMHSNLPLQIFLEVPRQPLPKTALPHIGKASAASIALRAEFRGLLLAPTTWQGDCLVQTIAPCITHGPHEAKFDRGSAITVLRGGQLSCLDARLIGDELSFLGNASLLANGTISAAFRLVATPEKLGGIVTTIFPTTTSPALTPLSTPQRAAFDLVAFGNIGQLHLQLGKEGPILNLNSSPAPP